MPSTMAPISPSKASPQSSTGDERIADADDASVGSGKRPQSEISSPEDEDVEQEITKYQRIAGEVPDRRMKAIVTDKHLYNDDSRQLLRRTIILALEHVGFTGATPEALEAFQIEVDSYTQGFLAQVTVSMANSRRAQPTPYDFKHALIRYQLPLRYVEPHLKPPIATVKSRVQLDIQAAEKSHKVAGADILLGGSLSGEPDKAQRTYIPRMFPSFPSKHTYKWTNTETARETNPRKIREEAAKSARCGEEALRRLMRVSQAGTGKDMRQAASGDPVLKERYELWENMMATFAKEKKGSSSKAEEEKDRILIVNSEKQYWRKGATAVKQLMPKG